MKYSIGKGKKYSIAKAGVIFFFFENEEYKDHTFLDWGELDAMHGIIDIAEAKHCSFLTSIQVIARLRNSPYWKCICNYNFYNGISNGRASLCEPSKKGIEYYNKYLKKEIRERRQL